MANEKLVQVDAAKAKLLAFCAWFNGPSQTEQDKLAQKIIQKCIEEIDKLAPAHKWTPVAEQLPDTTVESAEWKPGDYISYEVSDWLWGIDVNGMQGRVRYECGPTFEGWSDDLGVTWKITHWMPLPESPKGE